jgi:hypothetical protein
MLARYTQSKVGVIISLREPIHIEQAMISKAFIEEMGSHRLESEMRDVYDELQGIPNEH